MNVLMISNDRRILDAQSDSAQRMREYGAVVEQLSIGVLGVEGEPVQLSGNTVAYPVAATKLFAPLTAPGELEEIVRSMASVDIITAQDPFWAGLVGWLLRQRIGAPLEVQLHRDVLSPHYRKQPFLNRFRYPVERFILGRADAIRAVSPRMAQVLQRKGISRAAGPDSGNQKNDIPGIQAAAQQVSTLPIFVDIEAMKRSPITIDLHDTYSQYDDIVLMASRLVPEKNIPLALRAMRAVVERYPKTLLLIVGEGPQRKKLESKAKGYFDKTQYKKMSNVVFEPWVPQETLYSYYKTADLFLLTSNHEGYGRTLVEAVAVGLPIISTDVGIASELRNARVVPVGDEEALSQAITLALVAEPKAPALPQWVFSTKDGYLTSVQEMWSAL